MMDSRTTEGRLGGFLCKSLGVFENGGVFSDGKKDDDFWGLMDTLDIGCDRKMEFFDGYEARNRRNERNVLIRHDFGRTDSEGRDAVIPLSPETQKKNELCSYLQLMNMNNADKKTVSAIQNRRSNRVKNLKILSEKKSMEKQLLEEFEDRCDRFCFNVDMVPENVLREVLDFDDSIVNVIRKEIDERIEKTNNNMIENKIKVDLDLGRKRKKKLLRSSLNLNNVGIKSLILNECKLKRNVGKKKYFSGNKRKENVRKVLNKRKKLCRILHQKSRFIKTTKIKKYKKKPIRNIEIPMTFKLNELNEIIGCVSKTSENLNNNKLKSPNRIEFVDLTSDVSESEDECKGFEKAPGRRIPIFRIIPKTIENHTNKSTPQNNDKIVKSPSSCLLDKISSESNLNEINLVKETKIDEEVEKNRISSIPKSTQIPSPIEDPPSLPKITKFVFHEEQKLELSTPSFHVVDLSQNSQTVPKSRPITYFDVLCEHNYVKRKSATDTFEKEFFFNESTSCSEYSNEDSLKESYKEIPRINSVPPTDIFEPKSRSPPKKSLHKILMQKSKTVSDTTIALSKESRNSCTNSINLDEKKSGAILTSYYASFNLIIVQERLVSFWTQSPLGSVLGVPNLWVSRGAVERLPLDGNYVCKESREACVSLEGKSCAYVELWTKEHKSEKRELPLTDVFATVYFWTGRDRAAEPNRKHLQLANIKGSTRDVQYAVLRTARKIVVSWVETRSSGLTTTVSCYVLSPDYQAIVGVLEMASVDHYVQSLHTIGDCSDAVVGFGDNHITVWELEYGEVFESIEINQKYGDPKVLWCERDRGLLFLIQYHKLERLLMLVAVNGYSKESKKMQAFRIPSGYETLKGVSVDNSMLGAVFANGLICWNMRTGDEVMAELSSYPFLMPAHRHVIEVRSGRVEVAHFQTYFLSNFDLQS